MRFRFIPFALCLCAAGCAKSPAGGPTTPTAPNRLTVSLTLREAVNPSYYYAFAFDDDDDDDDGPVALTSSSFLPNGVVGGQFSVLVRYRAGSFSVFRRTIDANNVETLQPVTRAFVTQPSPANGNIIRFTLNLDATTDDGQRLFRQDVQRLDVNFVTTNEIRVDPNDLRLRAFDSLGAFGSGQYQTIQVNGTQTFTNATSSLPERAGDVITNDTTNQIRSGPLDITDYTLTVQRG